MKYEHYLKILKKMNMAVKYIPVRFRVKKTGQALRKGNSCDFRSHGDSDAV